MEWFDLKAIVLRTVSEWEITVSFTLLKMLN